MTDPIVQVRQHVIDNARTLAAGVLGALDTNDPAERHARLEGFRTLAQGLVSIISAVPAGATEKAASEPYEARFSD